MTELFYVIGAILFFVAWFGAVVFSDDKRASLYTACAFGSFAFIVIGFLYEAT